MDAILIESLVKKFGDSVAVDGISFAVQEGEIFGFLGPNGAGKSTTMTMLNTTIKPTGGRALVCGHDVSRNPSDVRRCIGHVQQESTADEFLTGRENLVLQARLNHIPRAERDSRIDEVLDLIELVPKQDDAVVTYSGGMRKRLDIAGGLLHMPRVLLLDEPTVGLDIQTRQRIWDYIRRIHDEYGMTIFLSTHYMEEADRLCDRIGIIDHGRIQVIDSPDSMKRAVGGDVITLGARGDRVGELVSMLGKIPGTLDVAGDPDRITVISSDGARTLSDIFRLASETSSVISSITLKQPTLDDVFISYTGRELRDIPDGYDKKREYSEARRRRRT